MENITELVEECLTNSKYTDGREHVKTETWEHIGEGAKRTVDYLINKYDELTKKGD